MPHRAHLRANAAATRASSCDGNSRDIGVILFIPLLGWSVLSTLGLGCGFVLQVVQVRLEANAAQLGALVRPLAACNDTRKPGVTAGAHGKGVPGPPGF